MKRLLTFIGILIVLCGLAPDAQADKSVIVSVDEDYYPYMYGTYAEPKGLYVELTKAVFARLEEPVKIIAIPWQRALQSIESDHSAIGGMYATAERLAKYDFSEPVYQEKLSAYVKASSEIEFNTVDDLVGFRIAAIKGWSYGERFDELRRQGKVDVTPVNSNEHALKLVFHNRVDAALVDEATAEQIIGDGGTYPNLVKLQPPLVLTDGHLAFNKKAMQTEFLARFNRVLQDMRNDGSYEKIVSSIIRD